MCTRKNITSGPVFISRNITLNIWMFPLNTYCNTYFMEYNVRYCHYGILILFQKSKNVNLGHFMTVFMIELHESPKKIFVAIFIFKLSQKYLGQWMWSMVSCTKLLYKCFNWTTLRASCFLKKIFKLHYSDK